MTVNVNINASEVIADAVSELGFFEIIRQVDGAKFIEAIKNYYNISELYSDEEVLKMARNIRGGKK